MLLGRLQALNGKLDGFDAEDLRALVDRAIHAAVRRHLNGNIDAGRSLQVTFD